uniref:Methyltransferase-like protein 4 n=1 Tax=Timema genevievae TaxID=629358 RepID=A0A7R9PHY2_TIMGE|nr:unnamed protein product [Timema genevievae]
MSILCHKDKEGWIISHNNCINKIYNLVSGETSSTHSYVLNNSLFLINTPYKKNEQALNLTLEFSETSPLNIIEPPKKKVKTKPSPHDYIRVNEVEYVQNHFMKVIQEGQFCGCFNYVPSLEDLKSNNLKAREKSKLLYENSSKQSSSNFHGGNESCNAVISEVENKKYIIPANCRFFCYDVKYIEQNLHRLDRPFDLILLDPPWWNKYIRRKNLKNRKSGYQMMYNKDLVEIPVASLISPGSLVAVWCTNCESHLNALKTSVFPAWGLSYLGKWFWIKVTRSGKPVCSFSDPPGKQPFEQIIFGWKESKDRVLPLPPDGMVVVSVPSAIHSHKPPLSELLSTFLPENPQCLELFARYLLPGWTSWGLEVLKLQDIVLYEQKTEEGS